jgi:hypothetical protein
MKYLKKEIGLLPELWRVPVENCISLGRQLHADTDAAPSTKLFLAGVLLIVASVISLININSGALSQTLKTMLMIVFSLGVGFVGAAIPGTLKVKATKWYGMRVDATSGVAFFVVTLVILLRT